MPYATSARNGVAIFASGRRVRESRSEQVLAGGLNSPFTTAVDNRRPQGKGEKSLLPQGTGWRRRQKGESRARES